MKIKNKNLFFITMSSLLYFGWKWKRKKEKYNNQKKEKVIYKQECALEVYRAWIQLYQMDKNIEEFLIENNYHSIAIYGLGRVGKSLFKELSKSNLTIDYVIDRKLSVSKGSYESILCYNPDAVLPKTDLIIIAVPGEIDNISLHLANCNSKVLSIQDILQSINLGY